MKNVMRILMVMAVMWAFTAITGCGGSSSGPDTGSCPAWNAGDSMSYLRTETVGTLATTLTATVEVTEHTAGSLVLSDGTATWTFSVTGGSYLPVTEELSSGVTTTYTSTTAFCPPPSAGASYEYTTWIPSPSGRGGDYETRTLSVSNVSIEALSLPAGEFTVRKLTMTRTTISPYPILPDSVVTRYYAPGIGVVKEVEEIPSTSTIVTRELTSYSFQ